MDSGRYTALKSEYEKNTFGTGCVMEKRIKQIVIGFSTANV